MKIIDFIKSNGSVIAIMLAIYIVIVYYTFVNYNQSIKSYDEYKFKELRNILNSKLDDAKANSEFLKLALLQNGRILDCVARATKHNTPENEQLRTIINDEIRNMGINFNNNSIGKINFILTDRTIFSRFFEPYSFDTLVPYKAAVEDVFRTYEPLCGFNHGIYHNMFSCFFPINKNNKNIGILEIGYPDHLIAKKLCNYNLRINAFLYPIDSIINADNRYFTEFSFIPGYQINVNSNEFISNNMDLKMGDILEKIDFNKYNLQERMASKEDIAIHKSDLFNTLSVYIFPIYDYENKLFGYYFHAYKNITLENKIHDLLIEMIVLALFSIIFLLYYINRKNLTNKLNARIQELNNLKNRADKLIRELNESQVELQNKAKFNAEINSLLQEQDEKLKKALDEKNKFFSILAHDIKNPISTIFTNAELMELYYEKMSPEERTEIINRLIQSSKNLESLVRDLLEWGQLQLNRIEIELIEFKLTSSIENAFNLIKDKANEKKVKLINAVDENVSIVSDKRIIDTIFRNLIQNAIKFTENGQISVEIFNQSKNYISIDVKDTGVGIPAQKINDLFKVDKAFTTKGTRGETGTGLGLVLIYNYLMKIDGRINVESQIGKGTRFTITLPKSSNL